jgi:hypothetical protein
VSQRGLNNVDVDDGGAQPPRGPVVADVTQRVKPRHRAQPCGQYAPTQ